MSSLLNLRVQLSQNFLRDSHLVAILLDRFDLGSDSHVYEIGAGEGIITEQLAQRYKRVIGIEKDERLADRLRRRFSNYPHVTILSGDFLRMPLPHGPYKVFANIPFNITSAIVARLIGEGRPPEEAYLTMQKEAAEMYLGKPHETLRTVLMKPWFEPELVYRFRRGDFVPAPRVDVVMLRLRKRGPPLISRTDRQAFRDFVAYMFTQWQPQGANPLNDLFTRRERRFIERELNFTLESRPTELSIEQWLGLFGHLKRVGALRTYQLLSGSERRLLQQQKGLQKIHRTRTVGRKM